MRGSRAFRLKRSLLSGTGCEHGCRGESVIAARGGGVRGLPHGGHGGIASKHGATGGVVRVAVPHGKGPARRRREGRDDITEPQPVAALRSAHAQPEVTKQVNAVPVGFREGPDKGGAALAHEAGDALEEVPPSLPRAGREELHRGRFREPRAVLVAFPPRAMREGAPGPT